VQNQYQAAAAAAAAGNNPNSYGKLFTYPPSFHALRYMQIELGDVWGTRINPISLFRYAPYPMAPQVPSVQASAAAAAAAQMAAANAQQQQQPSASQQPQNPQMTQSPYPGYNLTAVDMSGFNGIDWYGMNMYV